MAVTLTIKFVDEETLHSWVHALREGNVLPDKKDVGLHREHLPDGASYTLVQAGTKKPAVMQVKGDT